MTKKTTAEGAPQEEVAEKPVKKTRTPRKSTTSTTKRTNARKKKTEEEPAIQEVQVLTEDKTVIPANPDNQESSEKSGKPESLENQENSKGQEVQEKPKSQETQEKSVSKDKPNASERPATPAPKPIPPLPNIVINDIVELASAPRNQICLSDQQIQQLTAEEALYRFQYLEYTLVNVLNYDVVLSDTNIWLELLVGHTSSHSDPKVNARLQFERQLEFISKLMKHRGGRFTIMAETYEEIDRFATMQEPTNYRDADWTDEALCRNVAARLAKRLILSQQRENRLRIEGIGAESHHGAFADPVIIRRTVEMFAKGKKVLLLTNDASVAIRSMGMCDDLQYHNNIDDVTWDNNYAPLRPMVMTMDDLKMLDNYTRQYHFLQMAAGKQWLEDIPKHQVRESKNPELKLWLDGFRPGDRHERHSDIQARQKEQQRQAEAKKQKEEAQREAQRQKDLELQKQKDAQREAQRQKDLAQREAQRQRDLERQRQIDAQKQKEAETKKQQEAETKKQQELEAKKQELETKRQEPEAKKQQESETIKQQESETKELQAEAQRQIETLKKQEAEAKRQAVIEKAQAVAAKIAEKAIAKSEQTEPEIGKSSEVPAENAAEVKQENKKPRRGRSTSKSRTPRSHKQTKSATPTQE